MSGVLDRSRDVGPAATARAPAWRSALRPVLLMAGLVGAGVGLRGLPHGAEGPEIVGRLVAGHGPTGIAAFVLAAAAGCAIGLPRQLASFLGGYAFGAAEGAALALLAQTLGCLATFAWARAVARDWVAGRLGRRLASVDRLLVGHPFRATLTLRLLPLGNNLALNLLGGLSAVRALPFLAASSVGYAPQTVIFALLGSGSRISAAAQIAVGTALFAVSLALGFALLRAGRSGRRSPGAAPP